MKRITWTFAYFSAIGLLTVAPFLPTLGSTSPNGPEMVSDTTPTLRPVQLADELVLLTNDPSFPGGSKALGAYFDNADLYPEAARQIGLQGTVQVRFKVQPTGKLTNIKVVQSKGAILDKAVYDLISNMPAWFPAHRAGMAVPAYTQLLVTFRLNKIGF
ncbi:energy transducer TonB [Spirosoma endbachense]|uniref:TonB family protein n=1 Tax=Spirosoma endbachense TaxID=2666025 RepID=A0A6P1W891_9BACT|nr:energy transducer TonB [Spirosoma endbachense]QHW00131.1 TonB family protein [Spirosoma endbachense]